MGISHFDLMFHVTEMNTTIHVVVEYSTDLFKRSTMDKISGRFLEILATVVDDTGTLLGDIATAHDFVDADSAAYLDDQEDWEL